MGVKKNMELRDIYEECKLKETVINKVNKYFQDGKIPLKGTPYLISDPQIFFDVISLGTAQAKAPEFEKYLSKKTGWTKISPKLNRGDYYDQKKNLYIELKASFTNKEECLNLRQIRLWQSVDYYLAIYIDHNMLAESRVYLLTHTQMCEEVQRYGSATHGTTLANKENTNIEYSVTIPMKSSKRLEWDKKYFNKELFDLIFEGEK